MPTFQYKTVKVAAALISGLALVAPAAPAGAALPHRLTADASAGRFLEATPGTGATGLRPGATGLRPGLPRLREALLTPGDLPRGYAPTMSGYTGTIAGLSTDTNICDHKISSHGAGATAQAAFIRGIPGPMLFETLTLTGPRTARAIVAGIAAAPRLCKSFPHAAGSSPVSGLQLAPVRVPRLGDASSAIRFRVRPAGPMGPMAMDIRGILISVARRGVSVTLVQVNGSRADERELYRVAVTAIRKLDRAM
ncbi:MAG TPA: hypothetical protein VFW27_28745 [Actinoplanes sp.]|nr:hypothetical protein [Actinoplanes sp.]